MAAPVGSVRVVPPPRLEHYVVTEKLGQGTYATVYKAFKKVTFLKFKVKMRATFYPTAGLKLTSRRPCWLKGTKAYSPMGTRIILFQCKCCGKYMHCFAYQLGRLVTWLEFKNSGNPPVFYEYRYDIYLHIPEGHCSLGAGGK